MTPSIPQDPARLLSDLDFVRSLARSLCADEHTADDIAQEALVRAIEPSATPAANRRGFLTTLTKNLLHNRRRAELRRRQREQQAATSGAAPSAAEVLEREQLRGAVVRAVLELSDPYREVILLRHYRGYDVARCAIELQVPESTVRTQLSRGIERLRQRLDKDHDGDRSKWVGALLPLAMPTAGSSPGTTGSAAAPTAKKVAVFIAAMALVTGGLWSVGQMSKDVAPAHPPRAHTMETARADRVPASSPRELSAATVPLRQVASDPGFTRNVVRGRVVDANGLPVADAPVHAWAVMGTGLHEASRFALGDVRTDRDGRFTTSLLPLLELSTTARSQLRVQARVTAPGFIPKISDRELAEIVRHPDGEHLEVELERGLVMQGRVVARDGTPVAGATVAYRNGDEHETESTEQDGTFQFWTVEEQLAAPLLFLATHADHGVSAPRRAWPDRRAHTELGDLVLSESVGAVTGRVAFADDSPAIALDVELRRAAGPPSPTGEEEPDDAQDIVTIRGVDVPGYHEMIEGPFGEMRTQSDPRGRFQFRHLAAGSYGIYLEGEFQRTVDVPRSGEEVRFTLPYRPTRGADAQITVRIFDQSGRHLPEVPYGLHMWPPAEAEAAAQRYAKEGPTPQLLASAPTHFRDGGEHPFATPCESGSFAVIEASCHDAGPAYRPCLLQRGQHLAVVDVVLTPPTETGGLKIDMRDRSGRPLSDLLVRFCRVRTDFATPIEVANLAPADDGPRSEIAGRWFRVPEDGRVHGLPAGPITLELVQGRSGTKRWLRDYPHPVTAHEMTIEPAQMTQLTATVGPGCMLRVSVPKPALGRGERIDMSSVRVRVGKPGGRGREEFLRWQVRDREGPFRNGIAIASHNCPLEPGPYDVRIIVFGTVRRQHYDERAQRMTWRPVRTVHGELRQRMQMSEDMQPVPVTLEDRELR